MKRVLSLALGGALLLAVLAAPVLTRAAPAGASDKPGIAVLELQSKANNQGWNKAGAEAAQDEFVAELIKTRKFRVVSRQQLEALMREKNLSLSGNADAKTLMQAGRLLGVRYLLTSTVTQYGLTTGNRYVVSLNARLVDVNDGEIAWADERQKVADGKGDHDDSWTFVNMMKPCIDALVASLYAANL
jgi:curli biogenesis system outer membrane secretion channel CsgG